MSRDLVVIGLVVATAAGGCAHSAPKTAEDPYVVDAVASIRRWIGGLPRCPASMQATDLASLGPEANPMGVAVRGLLTLAATPECTLMSCSSGCCNTCFVNWVVVPETSAPARRELAIKKAGADHRLSAVVKDCKLEAIRTQIPKPEVIVGGFVEGDVVIRASLCVVEAPPKPKP
jgi:hypothetical protein